MIVFLGRVIEVSQTPEGREGTVSLRGALRVVALDAVAGACVGDTVLIEAGVAVAVVREAEVISTGGERPSCA